MRLPHNHDKNINTVLERMPESEKFSQAAEVFSQLGDGTGSKFCGYCATAANVFPT